MTHDPEVRRGPNGLIALRIPATVHNPDGDDFNWAAFSWPTEQLSLELMSDEAVKHWSRLTEGRYPIRLPSEWAADEGIKILDPDGWRRDGKRIEEAIGYQEYRQRVMLSTVEGLADPATPA